MDKIRLTAASGLLLAISANPIIAQAALEAVPYVGYDVEYDDNVFRNPSATEMDDTTQDAIIGGSLDYTAGRQRIYVEGSAYERRYEEFDFLDFDGNSISGGLDWGLGPSLSGEVKLDRTRDLRDFNNFVTQPPVRSVEVRTRGSADAELLVFSSFILSGGGGINRVRNSAPAVRTNDYEEEYGRVGFRYRGRSQWEIGVESTFTYGEYIERAPAAEYDQTTHALVARFAPGGGSSVDFGIGHTQRDNDFASGRDFSGMTTKLAYSRRISPKTSLYFGVRRNVASADAEGQDYAVMTNGNFRFDWDPISNLGLEFSFLRQRDDYRGAAQGREDDLTLIGLTADYEFARYFRFRPNLNWEDRSSNIASQEYDSFRAGLEIRLQYPIR